MQIETRLIKDLIPAIYNPRKNIKAGDAEWRRIEKSIKTYGMVEPVIINAYKGREGVVIGGHQRLKVLQAMGVVEVDCSVVDVDEAHEKALNLALNKISNEWDVPGLKALMEELDSGILPDIEITGFDLKEVEMMFTAAPPPPIEGEGEGSGSGEGKFHICPDCGCRVECKKSKKEGK
jgi:ParB-like chromosome segregation protein Spo0J